MSTAFEAAVARQGQAQDTSRSVWVAASAGAGKTRVLTSRIVRLLLEGADPASILALTYTKAAAKEMATRVISTARDLATADAADRLAQVTALLGHSPAPEVLVRAGALYEVILDTPGGLLIQTIHAFCQSLLGRFPFEAGLTPGFEAIEEDARAELLAQACAQVLRRQSDRFAALKAAARPETLTALADVLVRQDWQQMDASARLVLFDKSLGGGHSGTSQEALAQDFAAAFQAQAGGMQSLADRAYATGKIADQNLSKALANALVAADPLAVLVPHFITKGRLKQRGISTKVMADDPCLTWLCDQLPERQARVLSQRLYDLNIDVLVFGAEVSEAFQDLKAARAALDFDDLILAAGRLLAQDAGPTYVQYRLDQRLEHILVDEAQDTSAQQWALIAGLAEPFFEDMSGMDARQRTLFVVGDFKQSIYSFQGARPALFAGWRQRFEDLSGGGVQRVDMVHSFRAAPRILDFVDRVAEGLQVGGLRLDGQDLPRHRAVREGRPGLVQVWPAPPEKPKVPQPDWMPLGEDAAGGYATPRVTLGRALARHIHRLCYASAYADVPEAYVHSGETPRRVAPGDFLVLVQSRKTDFANAFIGQLKQLGVPVTGVDRLRLSHELVVQDLLALGDVCLQPRDDLALAALLKSPLYGVREADLFDLSYGRDGASLMSRLAAHRPDLIAEFRDLAACLGHLSLYDFYADYLFARCGRQRILASVGPEADEVLSLFLDRARAHDRDANGDMLSFLSAERERAQDVKRDASESVGQVRLMTVHGAKGLEAPIVILPDLRNLTHSGRGHVSDQMVPLSGLDSDARPDPGAIWVPSRAFDRPQTEAAKQAREAAQAAERERLLYVALTRAEERLLICTDAAQEDRPDRGQWSWYNRAHEVMADVGASTDLNLAAVGWLDGKGFSYGDLPPVPSLPSLPSSTALPRALPPWIGDRLDLGLEATSASPSALGAQEDMDPQESTLAPGGGQQAGMRAQALLRGTLIHAALEHLGGLEPRFWQDRVLAFFARQASDVAEDVRQTWAEETLAALENPDLKPFYGADSQAEVNVTGRLEGQVMVGQIDRLWVDVPQQVVHILDYKTNRPPPTDRGGVPPAYRAQMRAYAGLIQPLYPDFEVRTYLFWTHSGTLMNVTGL